MAFQYQPEVAGKLRLAFSIKTARHASHSITKMCQPALLERRADAAATHGSKKGKRPRGRIMCRIPCIFHQHAHTHIHAVVVFTAKCPHRSNNVNTQHAGNTRAPAACVPVGMSAADALQQHSTASTGSKVRHCRASWVFDLGHACSNTHVYRARKTSGPGLVAGPETPHPG